MASRHFRRISRESVRRAAHSSQRGFYIPMFALVIVAFIAIAGLAIDAAFLFRLHRTLQDSCDAGSMVAARLFLEPNAAPFTTAQVKTLAKEVVVQNMAINGSPIDPASVTIVNDDPTVADKSLISDDNRGYVKCTSTKEHQNFLMNILPGIEDISPVARSAGVNTRLAVSLVIDASSSMNYNDVTSPTGCSGCDTRMKVSKFAAKAFVDSLRDFDRVGVIEFAAVGNDNDWTNDVHKLRDLTELNSAGRASIQAGIDSVTVFGNTNIAAGIERAREQLASVVQPNMRKVIVVLTDGAPSFHGARYDRSTCLGTDMGGYSYLDPANDLTPSVANGMVDAASTSYPTARNRSWHNTSVDAERDRRDCYISTILQADAARAENITVYTIGLGSEDTDFSPDSRFSPSVPPNPALFAYSRDTPFQRGADQAGSIPSQKPRDYIKPGFMSRLANDTVKIQNSRLLNSGGVFPRPFTYVNPSDGVPLYPWDFPCVPRTYSLLNQPRGRYFFAGTGNELLAAFRKILKIRTRLDLPA